MSNLQRFHRREKKSPFPTQSRSQKSKKSVFFNEFKRLVCKQVDATCRIQRTFFSDSSHLLMAGMEDPVRSFNATIAALMTSIVDMVRIESWKWNVKAYEVNNFVLTHSFPVCPPPRWKYSIALHTTVFLCTTYQSSFRKKLNEFLHTPPRRTRDVNLTFPT